MYFIQLLSRVSGEQISRIETQSRPAPSLSLVSLSRGRGGAKNHHEETTTDSYQSVWYVTLCQTWISGPARREGEID